MRTKVVTHGEEAAIVLAIAYNPRAIIRTDSEEACRHFVQGSVSTLAHQILRKHPPEKVFLIWTQGHTGRKGNEAANATARGLLIRAPSRQPPSLDMAIVTLTKEDEYILRRLQTDTLPTLAKLHSWYPSLYSPFCPHCREKADAYHTVWACQHTPTKDPISHTSWEQWEAILRSDDPACQHWLVESATAALEASGILELG
ncbi:hypothetical protein HPB47_001685 [Ixodes persulcatus]|uniref:Uncharacterized protein n=1 Tax=Ixodes persulcatus TaxID=34615 RepID=A0AC60PND8_IXOPE|nr:hypothetical protein HPB47_001685 [Ixodes persulcatus]